MSSTDLICDFVNTRDVDERTDALGSPAELAMWLAAHGVAEAGVEATPADLKAASELREALREALLANNGVDADADAAFAVLDRVAEKARIRLCFVQCAGELSPQAGGVPAALGRIAIAVHETMSDGTWPRLKACRASDCEWAFFDTAKNHSRAWCSMGVCGNRAKARSFRARRRA